MGMHMDTVERPLLQTILTDRSNTNRVTDFDIVEAKNLAGINFSLYKSFVSEYHAVACIQQHCRVVSSSETGGDSARQFSRLRFFVRRRRAG